MQLVIDLEGLPDPYQDDPSDAADRVRRVADLLDEGYTSGVSPTWSMRDGSVMKWADVGVIARALRDGEASHYTCQSVAHALKKEMDHAEFDLDYFYRECLPEGRADSYRQRRANGETPDAASWTEHNEIEESSELARAESEPS